MANMSDTLSGGQRPPSGNFVLITVTLLLENGINLSQTFDLPCPPYDYSTARKIQIWWAIPTLRLIPSLKSQVTLDSLLAPLNQGGWGDQTENRYLKLGLFIQL